jgi:hypothetical protein
MQSTKSVALMAVQACQLTLGRFDLQQFLLEHGLGTVVGNGIQQVFPPLRQG